jgi:hypothetical protein
VAHRYLPTGFKKSAPPDANGEADQDQATRGICSPSPAPAEAAATRRQKGKSAVSLDDVTFSTSPWLFCLAQSLRWSPLTLFECGWGR